MAQCWGCASTQDLETLGAAGLTHRLEAFKDRQSILSHLIPHCSQGEGEGEHGSPVTNSHRQGAKPWEHSPHTNTLMPTPALIHPLSPDSPLLFCHSLVYPGFPQPPPPGSEVSAHRAPLHYGCALRNQSPQVHLTPVHKSTLYFLKIVCFFSGWPVGQFHAG